MYKKYFFSFMLLVISLNKEVLYSSENSNESIEKLIAFITTQVAENSNYIYQQIDINTKEIRKELGDQITKHSDDIAKSVFYIGSVAIIQTGNVLYEYFFPTSDAKARQEEAEVRIQEAKKRSAFLKAEANFLQCLRSINKDAQRNAERITTKCETFARDLILCDGKGTLNNMMNNFENTIR